MMVIGLDTLVKCHDIRINPNFREYFANLYDTFLHSGRLHEKPQNNETPAI
jgi:hypothetical protein